MAPLIALLIAATVTGLLVQRSGRPNGIGCDLPGAGPQNHNRVPVRRIGGLGLGLGMLAGHLAAGEAGQAGLWLLGCGVPALLAGVAEDLTRRVGAWWRLLSTALAAALAVALTDASLPIAGPSPLVPMGAAVLVSALITVFAVGGVCHAVNLIDGFNGLASGCLVLVLLALALVAWQVGDGPVLTLALTTAGAVLGFMCWNFPGGRILLGDGGAYLLGFVTAELGLLLVARNPEVSLLLPLLLLAYPVWETLFTVWRRWAVQRRPVMQPDALHLHSLVFRRVLRRRATRPGDPEQARWRNPATSVCLWPLCLLAVLPGVVWWHSSVVLAFFGLVFCLVYGLCYRAVVRFRIAPARRTLRLPWRQNRSSCSPFDLPRRDPAHGRVIERR